MFLKCQSAVRACVFVFVCVSRCHLQPSLNVAATFWMIHPNFGDDHCFCEVRFLTFPPLVFSFNEDKSGFFFFAQCPRGPIRTWRSALIRQLFLSYQPHSINLHLCPSFYCLPCAHSLSVPLFICLSSDGRQFVFYFWAASHLTCKQVDRISKATLTSQDCKDEKSMKYWRTRADDHESKQRLQCLVFLFKIGSTIRITIGLISEFWSFEGAFKDLLLSYNNKTTNKQVFALVWHWGFVPAS